MNGGGSSASGLSGSGRALEALERQEPGRERDGEQAAALWLALAQQVNRAHALPACADEPTNAWHPSAGDMTPPAGHAPATGGSPAEPAAAERMTLRVDGGALGELEVVLERQDGALRVVIGMENQHLVASMLPESRALQRALEGVGITVRSLNVVPESEVGTVLAQRRLSSSKLTSHAEAGAEQETEKPTKRNPKRLTLIG